jgi:hypothetical protein
VESALAYAETYRDEIGRLVEEHRELDDEAALRRILPSLRVSEV